MAPDETNEWDVFLSYSRVDRGLVDQIREMLERHRINCFQDYRSIEPGENWVGAIDNGIGGSRWMICFLSPAWSESKWTRREWTAFAARNLDGIIPIYIQDTEPPRLLETLQCVRAGSLDEYHKVHGRLVKQLRLEPASHAPATAATPELDLDSLRTACQRQVSDEVERSVGTKYLEQLYQPRPVEEDIRRFLSKDPASATFVNLTVALAGMRPDGALAVGEAEEQRNGRWRELLAELAEAENLVAADRVIARAKRMLSNSSRQALMAMHGEYFLERRPCVLIKDRAGSGKTNLLSHLALAGEQPDDVPLFLTCKFDLGGRTLQQYVGERIMTALESQLGAPLPSDDPDRFMRSLIRELGRRDAQLVIYLDGINEHRDLERLDNAILEALSHWESGPIKLVVTCRDIFWDFFDERRWRPYLHQDRIYDLPPITGAQLDRAVDVYLAWAEIKGEIVGKARRQLEHPLLLRFFCEAHRGQKLRVVEDIRLKDLFSLYWSQKMEEMARALGHGARSRGVERFVYQLVGQMIERSAAQVTVQEASELIADGDVDSPRSIYQLLLDQHIIIEELPPENVTYRSSMARKINFVYDEFFDYVAARWYMEQRNWSDMSEEEICEDFVKLVKGTADYEQLRGITEYMVLLGKHDHLVRQLCMALGQMGQAALLGSILPKLPGDMTWAMDTLQRCLEALEAGKQDMAQPAEGVG